MITHDLFEPTPQQLRRAEQALEDARNRRARQDWPQPAARRSDPETSKNAALAAAPRAAGGRMLALTLLAQRGPATDFELEAWSGVKQTSIGVRRGQLRDKGLVQAARDSLNRIKTRPAPSGARATVWELTSEGIALFAEMHGAAGCGEALPAGAQRSIARQGTPRASR